MLDNANLRLIRRASFMLCAASLAALISACTHLVSPNTSAPRSWVVENVASKSTAELYADVITPGVYKRSNSKEIDGYAVESGNLMMPDKSTGSLVAVRSKDGSLTAVVEKSGESGLLVINSKGESRFTPYPARDYSLPDTVESSVATKQGAIDNSVAAGPYVIDMLIGYSRPAVVAIGGDAYANALAQVESVNLALRNSLISNVSMKLAGIQIVEQEHPITTDTLNRLHQIFSTGISEYQPDMVYGVFGGHPDDSAGGWGHLYGRFAIGSAYGEAFRHEVGHNVGGDHCHVPGGIYNYGFANGKTYTAMCGNGNPYYSTPAVRDAHGLSIGDEATADMARVWRENAQRLSSYAIKTPQNFRNTGSTAFTATFTWDPSPEAVGYNIYFTSPTTQNPVKTGTATGLTYTARVISERTMYYVKAVSHDGRESDLSNGASK